VILKEEIHSILVSALESAKKDGLFPDEQYPVIKVEYPKEEKFGDYATPFAMECAKILKKNPVNIANDLKTYIEESEMVEKVEVVKPGFINIFVSFDLLASVIERVKDQNENYGKSRGENLRKVNIEFVSANPTGPMNVVSARAAALGDTLANLMEATGDTVDREFYVNDYGNQVRLLGESVLARMKEQKGEDVTFPEDGYHGEYIKDIASHIIENNSVDIDSEDLVDLIAKEAIEYNVSGQKKDLESLNVHFKTWFRERPLHETGEVEKTYDFLESKNVIYETESKKFFRSTDYDDDKDRCVIRDDGRPTYLMADIAYHKDKLNRGYDKIINIWGPDHHGYIARLKGAMLAMGAQENQFEVLIAQQVNLVMEGETVKMSKRLGNFSTMKELLEEIGSDVARYFFVMRSLDSHLDFDLALAKKESSENPVFYLQYAHARICSIFLKAEERGAQYKGNNIDYSSLNNPEALQLLKYMIKFPEEIIDAATSCEPHRISTFLMRFAQSFHKLYTEHRIVSDDTVTTAALLNLADAARIVMKNGLKLLGVSAPERM